MSWLCCLSREDDSQTNTISLSKSRKLRLDHKPIGEELSFVAEKPETPQILKYPHNCPICFRYFNRILKTSCCGNYLCELCLNDLNRTLKKTGKTPTCSFCNEINIRLKPLQTKDAIKKYSDSPYLEKIMPKNKDLKIKDLLNIQQSEQLEELVKVIDQKILEKVDSKENINSINQQENQKNNTNKVLKELLDFKIRLEVILNEEIGKENQKAILSFRKEKITHLR